ncbi:MAG: type IV toxin-antitoxin system AbiEi family antitoxin [Bdellovibrionales bacterium]|nr:type IV toxin-antitoxin system AbiEi family antitoxin [Bdellovibrionales bacterium]
MKNKLNQLLSYWPDGEIRTSQQLQRLGYGSEHLQKYKKSKWIDSVGKGAYKKYGDSVDWTSALSCLQKDNPKGSLYVGGKSALELLGKAQYLLFDKKEILVICDKGFWMPSWVNACPGDIKIHHKQKCLFDFSNRKNDGAGLTERVIEKNKIILSAAERAYLEYLDEVPQKYSYTEAIELLENLATLRPDLVQELLEKCKSVKVKRLFLYLADKINHIWFKKIQPEKINLGEGKRLIFRGGVLDKKYNITVPKEDSDEDAI